MSTLAPPLNVSWVVMYCLSLKAHKLLLSGVCVFLFDSLWLVCTFRFLWMHLCCS